MGNRLNQPPSINEITDKTMQEEFTKPPTKSGLENPYEGEAELKKLTFGRTQKTLLFKGWKVSKAWSPRLK